jgi:hypothetical protein
MVIGSTTTATHTTTSAEQIGAGEHHPSSGIVRGHHNNQHAALDCTTDSRKRPHGDAFDGNAKNEELNDVHRLAVTPSPPSVLNENGAGTDLSRHTSNIRKTNKDNNNDADTSHHEDINGVNNKVKHEDDAAPPTIPSSIPSHSHYQHPMYYPPHPTNPMYYPYSDPAPPLNSYYQHPMYPPHPMYPMVYPYSGPPPPLNSYDQHPMYPPHPNHPSGYHWNMLFCNIDIPDRLQAIRKLDICVCDEDTRQLVLKLTTTAPHNNDVLCGRGGTVHAHPGNKQYRKFVDSKKRLYLTAQFKRENLDGSS